MGDLSWLLVLLVVCLWWNTERKLEAIHKLLWNMSKRGAPDATPDEW